jgi:hypothetical protein
MKTTQLAQKRYQTVIKTFSEKVWKPFFPKCFKNVKEYGHKNVEITCLKTFSEML